MSAENKALVRRAIEAFNRGDLDGLTALVAPDYMAIGDSGCAADLRRDFRARGVRLPLFGFYRTAAGTGGRESASSS